MNIEINYRLQNSVLEILYSNFVPMTISGFTFARNSQKYYFPIKESIQSILPIVDEFVVALGDCDSDDRTREEIESIGSTKIRIIDTQWDVNTFPHNTVYAQQTDIAKGVCKGDWLFYLQNDEVVHQADHKLIVAACNRFEEDSKIEGLLFEYKHFWGDYDHYHQAHNWYPREIRVIRNNPEIHAWKDAQSFRRFSEFECSPLDYLKKKHSSKLNVARINVTIYHYGWVRPPEIMTNKARVGNPSLAQKNTKGLRPPLPDQFDYGPLNRLAIFEGTHPQVMSARISQFDWKNQLQYTGKRKNNRPLYKHERLRYSMLSWLEYTFLGGRQIGGFKNYRIKK